jgi:hypothetical protein
MDYKIGKNYDPLNRLDSWDKETRHLILERIKMETGPEMNFNFFSFEEGEILKQIIDILIDQDKNEGYVKIAEAIDRKLSGKRSGVRYGQNPWPDIFYKQGLDEFRKDLQAFIKKEPGRAESAMESFISKILGERSRILLCKFLDLVLRDAVGIYYSHPVSWKRSGFPGPAYPEGYPFLACGEKEEWEPGYIKST